MNRREFVSGLGVFSASAVAGCASSNQPEETSTTVDRATKDPIPGEAVVYGIEEITHDSLTIRLDYPKIPRKVTLELYAESPTPSDPGEWSLYNFGWNGDERVYRPFLEFEEETSRRLVSTTETFPLPEESGSGQITFSHEKQPAGTAIQYAVVLVEQTLENQRRWLGPTEMVFRAPGEDTYQTQDFSRSHFEGFQNLGSRDRVEDESGVTVRLVGSTNHTRWWEPPNDGEFPTRPLTSGQGSYTREAFERPWSLEYTINKEDYDKAIQLNNWFRGSETAMVGEIVEGPYHPRISSQLTGNPYLESIAEDFNTVAEQAGLTSPLEKLRFVCGITQWMPYKKDSTLAYERTTVKLPLVTLYEYGGDCEDKSLLALALLYQDAFPDYQLGLWFLEAPAHNVANHMGLAVKTDLFDIDITGQEENGYMYAECTYPAPLDYVDEPGDYLFHLLGVQPPGHEYPPSTNEPSEPEGGSVQ